MVKRVEAQSHRGPKLAQPRAARIIDRIQQLIDERQRFTVMSEAMGTQRSQIIEQQNHDSGHIKMRDQAQRQDASDN
jgi:hypothetical protein